MARDPFATFDLSPTMHLDLMDLETRYFVRSRQVHPDHVGADTDLFGAAELNDDYRTLRDPWRRARAICEVRDPGVLVRHERLDPGQLEEALELAEAVAEATGTAVSSLSMQIRGRLDAILRDVTMHLDHGDVTSAAILLNLARYWQKASSDLVRHES